MDQRVSLRRFVVPVLLAGLTLCGSLGWSSAASAREPAAARIAVTSTHVAPAARASHPSVSASPVRSTASQSTTPTAVASKTVSLHLTRGTKLPSAHSARGNF
jgi:hypothetical protein